MILVGERSLTQALKQFCGHYHRGRNHQGLENEIIETGSGLHAVGKVRRRERLGGLLRYYYPANSMESAIRVSGQYGRIPEVLP